MTRPSPVISDGLAGVDLGRHALALLRAREGLTSELLEPTRYNSTPVGFGRWLQACGCWHVSTATELVQPPSDVLHLYSEAGRPSLVPPRIVRWPDGRRVCGWSAMAAVVLLCDQYRRRLKLPIHYRHGYRPERWNRKLSGAEHSDHLFACAVDIVLVDDSARRQVLKWVREEEWDSGALGLSVGSRAIDSHGRKIHIGLWAPRTVAREHQRTWVYGAKGPLWR